MKILVAILLALPVLAAPFQLRPELPISEPEYSVVPNGVGDIGIATDGDGYLAVWTDQRAGGEHSVWAARLRADGSVIDRTGIRVTFSASAGPVVWTGSKYLFAYDEEPGPRTFVRTMTRDGVIGEPVEVANDNRSSRFGSMATNGTNVLLAFNGEALLLDLEGHKLRSVPLTLQEDYYNPSVAAAGSTYLVAAQTYFVRAQTVSSDGVTGAVHTIGTAGKYGRMAIASDGERFLVAWPNGKLQTQLVGRDGAPIGSTRALTNFEDTAFPKLAWRDGEYFALINDTKEFGLYTMRIAADGSAAGEPKRIDNRLSQNTAIAAPGRGGIALFDHMRAGVFDDASLSGEQSFRKVFDVAIAAKTQANVHLARLRGGYVAAWEEEERIFLSSASGATPIMVVGSAEKLIDVLVDRSDVVWVLWGGESYIAVTRFTPNLQAIDPSPIYLHVREPFAAAAAGDGVIALAYTVRDQDRTEDSADVAALLLRETGSGIERKDILLTTEQFVDRNVSIAFDGAAFVYGWVHNKGPYPEWLQPPPANEIVGARVSPSGDLLDALPIVIASPTAQVYEIESARGANGVAFAWQVGDKTTQAAVFGGPVRDFGGEAMSLGALTPHDGGFLLVRGHARRTPSLTEVEYLNLGADLTLRESGSLPPYEADTYYKWFDIDVIGGAEPVFVYAKSAMEGRFGHVSRIFVRRTGETPPRKRLFR